MLPFFPSQRRRRAFGVCAPVIAALLFPCIALTAWAHRGPPFPILQNRAVGPVDVSVWTNPDVGNGLFYILINPVPGKPIPKDLAVQLAVRPLSGRLAEKTYTTERKNLRKRIEFKAVVPFDRVEEWRVRVLLRGTGITGEADVEVHVMPAGSSRWDFLLFTLPFLGIGLLWLWAVGSKRWRKKTEGPSQPISPWRLIPRYFAPAPFAVRETGPQASYNRIRDPS